MATATSLKVSILLRVVGGSGGGSLGGRVSLRGDWTLVSGDKRLMAQRDMERKERVLAAHTSARDGHLGAD